MSENPGRGYGKTAGGNYYRPTIIGHGSVPIKQCMKILKNTGFEGCLAVEFEGIEDPYLATEISFENIKRFLEEIETSKPSLANFFAIARPVFLGAPVINTVGINTLLFINYSSIIS